MKVLKINSKATSQVNKSGKTKVKVDKAMRRSEEVGSEKQCDRGTLRIKSTNPEERPSGREHNATLTVTACVASRLGQDVGMIRRAWV